MEHHVFGGRPAAGAIVGHVVTSRGTLHGPDGTTRPILGLGPISVLPERQGQGIGGALYEKLCFAKLGPVLDTLAWIKQETNVWLEVTTLLIPGENDSEAELAAMSRWAVEHLGPDVPWHFTAFHPDYRLRDKPAQ